MITHERLDDYTHEKAMQGAGTNYLHLNNNSSAKDYSVVSSTITLVLGRLRQQHHMHKHMNMMHS
jgi:hypothetical protein